MSKNTDLHIKPEWFPVNTLSKYPVCVVDNSTFQEKTPEQLKALLDDFIEQISETKYPVDLDEEILGEKVISVSFKVYRSIEKHIVYGRYKGYLIDFNRSQPANLIFSNL